MCVSIHNCNLSHSCTTQTRSASRCEQRLIYFFFALPAAVAFSTVLFGLDWFPVNLVFGLVPRLPMLPMLCRLARSLAFFREPLLFLSRTSLSCRTKMPCRDLHLKYLVPLTDPSFLPGMEIKNKTALGIQEIYKHYSQSSNS